MVKDKFVPKLRFDFEHSDFKKYKLGELVDNVVAGATPKTSVDEYWNEGDIPWLSSGEVHKKYIYFTDKFITSEGYNNSSTKLVPKNSVLIALAGQGKTRGTVAINKIELCTNQSIASIIPNNNLYYKFLFYYLESKYDYLRALSSSDGGRGGLNLKLIRSIPIKIPSFNEQKKISDFIELIDKKRSILEKKYEYYQDFKKYLMQQIFAQKLRFNFKREWEEKYVNEIFDITRGDVIAKKLIHDSPNEEYCYPVFSSQTTNKGIMGYYNDYDFNGEYITWTTDGANAGKTVYRNGKFKCSNVCGVLKAKSEYSGFANPFIAEYLDSITYKYVSYVGNPKLMNNIMAKIKIKYPPLEEQEKISKLFEFVDFSVDLIQNQKEMVEDFKKGLLQQMFV